VVLVLLLLRAFFGSFVLEGWGLMELDVVVRAGVAGHDYRFMGFFILRVIERRQILRAARMLINLCLTIAYVRMQGYVSKAEESAAFR